MIDASARFLKIQKYFTSRFPVAAHGKTEFQKRGYFKSKRKMILTTEKDMVFCRKKVAAINKLKRRSNEEEISYQPTTDKAAEETLLMPSKLLKLQPAVGNNYGCSGSSEKTILSLN